MFCKPENDKCHKRYKTKVIYLRKLKKHQMNVIYIMIFVSIIIALLFLVVFIKSVKSGQFEDMYTPSVRMLFDDELVKDTSTLKQDHKL